MEKNQGKPIQTSLIAVTMVTMTSLAAEYIPVNLTKIPFTSKGEGFKQTEFDRRVRDSTLQTCI